LTIKKESRFYFLIFLFFYLAFVFVTYQRYGDTCDERDCYSGGGLMLRYYAGHTTETLHPEYASHNYIYTTFSRLLSLNKGIVFTRLHGLNMLFALSIFWAFYELLYFYCKNGRWAFVGPLVLFLTPRFLGDIPANPKDMPFAVLYFLSLTAMIMGKKWFPHRWSNIACLGIIFGFTFSNRIVGLTLFPLYALFRVYEDAVIEKKLFWANGKVWVIREIPNWIFVFLVSQLVACAFWPYLGADYLHHFPEAIAQGKKFDWDSPILFWGRFVQPAHLPWSYLPGWICATTPIFLLFFFCVSIIRWKKLWSNKVFFLMVSAFSLNLSLYFFLRPVIYNGLRHFLFVVPILVFIASLSLIDFFKNIKYPSLRWICGLLVGLNVLAVATHLVRLFPYDYIYFNELVGGVQGASGKFEMDYWGESLRETALWMKANIPRMPGKIYRIKLDGSPWQETNYFPDYMTGDIKLKPEEADYCVILNGIQAAKLPSGGRVIHIVQKEGVPLTYVVQMK
jgi:hypothetical protein